MNKKKILVTGGAGYIGSHILVELQNKGYDCVVFDNLSNSSFESLKRVSLITGIFPKFIKGDIRDLSRLRDVFSEYSFDAVIHLAGLKAVGESVKKPLMYYDNNVHGSQNLLQAMSDASVYNLVFSSSATVYGNTSKMPVSELCPVSDPANPYGRSKLMVENVLRDLSVSDSRWNIAILRYFNPIGAHESGLIGEDPNGVPNNLLPYISQVAIKRLEVLPIFGNDYPTPDGTGVRDYIHVVDLARGHLSALALLLSKVGLGACVWNLGTGKGYSVLEVIHAFELASERSISYKFVSRRSGDIATCYADVSKAGNELGWTAKLGLREMMLDSWRWQSTNPNGYKR